MGWVGSQQNLNQGALGAAVILGIATGALGGGKLMIIGRRKALYVSILLGIIGNSITMILNYPCIILGRFIFGISTGLFSAIVPRYI